MYVLLYNRLTGWLWFFIGVWSLFSPNIGDYMYVTTIETYVCLALGLLGMFAARLNFVGHGLRNQVITCGTLTLMNGILLIVSSLPGSTPLLHPTPLEGVFEFLCVVWGVYCLYHEIKQWVVRVRPTE